MRPLLYINKTAYLYYMKTYKFKLYTSKKTEYLDTLLNTACDVYNYALAYKKQLYNADKTSISKYDLQKVLVNTKSSDGYDSWNELGSQVIQQITDRIYNGYNLFFRNLKQKQKRKVKLPNFKKYFKYKSITFKQAGYKVLSGNTIKIGDKLFKYHKSREIQGEIKTLTVKRNSLGEYFIFVTTDYSDLTRSTSQLARAHEDIANRRSNFHWQLANKLVKQYGRIFLEDLNIHEMKSRFGRKVSDLGFAEFVAILCYVAEKHSSVITKIDRWFPSSKTCNYCSNIYKELNIREREWLCSKCGVVHDRDFNAAVNILLEGVRITVGTSTVKIAAVNPGLCQVSGDNLRIPRL